MAVNKPTGDNAGRGAVKTRTQLKTKLKGESRESHWTKRDKTGGKFMIRRPAQRNSRASAARGSATTPPLRRPYCASGN
jgi:hypothetical protein